MQAMLTTIMDLLEGGWNVLDTVESLINELEPELITIMGATPENNNIHRSHSTNLDLPQLVIKGRESEYKYADDKMISCTGFISMDLFDTGSSYLDRKLQLRKMALNNGYKLIDYSDLTADGKAYHASIIITKKIYQQGE